MNIICTLMLKRLCFQSKKNCDFSFEQINFQITFLDHAALPSTSSWVEMRVLMMRDFHTILTIEFYTLHIT